MSTGVPSGPSEALKQYIKMRVSLKDEPVVMFHTGEVFQHISVGESTPVFPPTGAPARPNKLLFRTAGYTVSRAYYGEDLPRPDGSSVAGYAFMSRNLLLYLDPATGTVLNTWRNDLLGQDQVKTVNVLHVQNDPGNWIMSGSDDPMYRYYPHGEDKVLSMEQGFFSYPSPLAGEKYKLYSAHDVYQAAELLHFFVDKRELLDPNVASVQDIQLSWFRFGPYLPWMQMGQAPGGLVYMSRGYKVRGGFTGLPVWLRQEVHANYPQFAEPPSGPFPKDSKNASTWTFFRQEVDAGRYRPAEG